jgi:hypothetical protein
MSLAAERFLDEPDAPVSSADAFLDAPDNAPVSAADAFLNAPTPEEAEQQNIVIRTIGNIGNAAQRGYYQSRLATELQQPQPDANRVIELQQAMQQVPASPEYMATMNDELAPGESWNAFVSNPVSVMGEMLTESLVSFGEQMMDKAPAYVGIGTAAGTAGGAAIGGVGSIPGAAVGARSGLTVASFSASRALEASDGILRSLEEAGVPMNDPQALSAALNDPERMQVAREFADKKAVPVALFDAASMLLGGRLMGQKPLNALQKIGRGGIETAVQALIGMGGEATGQLNQDGQITSGRSIMAEGLGEVAPGMAQVAMGTRLEQAERRGMPEPQPAQAVGEINQSIAPNATPANPAEVNFVQPTSTPVDQSGTIPTPSPLPDPPAAVKPRTFEQKAMESDAITPAAKEQIGSFYGAYSFPQAVQAAKDWVNTNGLEAAQARMQDFNRTKVLPSPVDIAIGMEAAAKLGALGQHDQQAALVMDLSEIGTAAGQAISIYQMLPRMTPEGITIYAQKQIAKYIGGLPADRQKQMLADQESVKAVRGQLGTMRTDFANKAIGETPYGGETIKDRIARRIGDKEKYEPTFTGLRDIFVKANNKTEAKASAFELLQQNGLSPSESESLSRRMTDQFYSSLDAGRRELASSFTAGASNKRILQTLQQQLGDGAISDTEFVARLSQSKSIPILTDAVANKLKDYAGQYQQATDPDIQMVLGAKMHEEIAGLVPNDIYGKLRSTSYLTMLFAPKTWIRNIGGNTVQFIANAGRDAAIGYVVDPLTSIVRGDNKRTAAGMGAMSRLKAMATPIVDMRKGYEWNAKQNPEANVLQNTKAALSHLRVLSKLTTQNKWELNDVKDVGRRMFSNKYMQMLESTLSVALGTPDRAFYMSQFRGSLAQMETAAKQNGEWTGHITPDMYETAQAEAMYAIYQDPNRVSKTLGDLRRVANLNKEFGVGTAILPFTQVPGSILKKGVVDWSPVGFVKAISEAGRAGLFGKEFNQAKFNKDFTQAAIGTAGLYSLGHWLAGLGIITSVQEDDKDLEAMRRASGLGSYRINATALNRAWQTGDWRNRQDPEEGDTVVSYDWVQPMAITLAAGADVYYQEKMAGRKATKEGTPTETSQVVRSMMAGTKTLSEQPLLGGLGSFMRAYNYNKNNIVEAVYDTALGMPSMFVPQLIRQAAQYRDNTMRETGAGENTQRAFAQVAAQLPGASEMFPPRFDIMGQAQERYQYGGNSIFNIFLNPAMVTKIKKDPVLSEAQRLIDSTGDQTVAPRSTVRSVELNGKRYDLTNEQISAYQFYVGNYTMARYQRLMASPRFARLPDSSKVDVLAKELKDVHAATKSAVLGQDPRSLTRQQRSLRSLLIKSPLGQMPPTGMPFQSYAPSAQ